MSILTKPYEISVWVDEWNGEKFVEKQLDIIGANNMIAQGRALDPKLTRNINGTKSLTFQMYKQYIDNTTGEKVNNVFADWLINERKVKLKYGTYIDENGDTKDCWYDFLVKNITENSANYLCTYSLEDAFVQELSKNGFGVVLSQEQMNNIGTVEKLATEVLKETDWKVSSENFVQTIEEALVYVSLPRNLECQKITNEGDVKEGVKDETVIINDSGHGSALAFYSSCKNKPHRFQFIYLKEGYSRDTVLVDNRGVIKLSECQYFIDIENPEEEYKENNNGYFLPDGWDLFEPTGTMGNKDSTLSSWYRGSRYGYTQATEYVPLLEKYCDVYYKTEGEKEIKYYGYLNNTYTSPATNQNVIVNDGFDGTSGWVGTYFGEGADLKSTVGAKVESVYGRFDNDKFISVIDDLKSPPTLKEGEKITYESYLKVEFPDEQNGNKPVLINNGFYENRLVINNVKMNEEWCLKYEFLDEKGKNSSEQYDFALQETNYDIDKGNYSQGTIWTNPGEVEGEKLLVFKQPEVSDKEFKEKKIRLVISSSKAHTFYIKKLSLYRRILSDDGQTIEPGEIGTEGVIETSHRLFTADQLKTKKSAEDIEYITVDKIDYKVYQPDYNPGAKKIRAVSVKESNYFNILQSIAETFECWLELKVTRDEDGAIDEKFVFFRNYIGKDNYANFKYGVNLKDIQRTEESKNIVTKLIVKQNNNQHAENEFCTIARAPSNPLGENYIYDFSYYWSKELMDRDEYCDLLYHPTHPKTGVQEKGPDLGHAISECNLQNYVNRVKNINLKLEDINSKIGGLQLDLIDYNARLSIQENLRDAAASGREETVEEFYQLTGYLPTEVNKADDLDLTAESITQLLVKYTKFLNEYETAVRLIGDENGGLFKDIKDLEKRFADKKIERDNLLDYKTLLNQLFFTRYAPFIQEGTWLDEEYFEDEKYYADALSVMRESCSPQAAYTINVVALGAQPGYELFDFEIGDKTYVEDVEFFGEGVETEVVVAEMTECLDSPDKNSIKTQTFKNQFQDLFQKITATVQQAEYNTGSYERAVSFVSADGIARGKFISDSLSTFGQKLSVAGQTSVIQDINGITLTDSATKDQLRLIGGAIMMSVEDKETGVRSWRTGLTPDGITASLITTGTLNAGEIQIMNVNDPLFRWDANGLTALNSIVNNKVLKADPTKFVRFDKYGLYGMVGKNGLSYVPENLDEVVKESTFALTWQGLKVSSNNAVLNIGNGAKVDESDDTLLNIKDSDGNTTFAIKNDGSLSWGASSTPTRALYSTSKSTEKPIFAWDKYPESAGEEDPTGWHRTISANDRFASYSYDGGNTWTLPIKIAATDGTPGKSIVKIVEYYARSKDLEQVPGNVATDKTEAWGVTLNNPTKDWPYLWNYEISYYDESMSDSDKAGVTDPVRIAQYVENGADGADGEEGRGIEKIQNYYLINSGSTPNKPTGASEPAGANPSANVWYTTAPKTSLLNRYLWNCEIITYTKEDANGNTIEIIDPAVIGTHGASSYAISLDEDFISVQAENDGTVASGAFPSTAITPTAFYGDVAQTFTKDATSGLGLFITTTGLSGSWNTSTKKYTVTAFSGSVDRGTVEFTLKKDNVAVAHAVFEAVKQKAGANGTNGQYIYAICDYDELKIGSFPEQLTILMQKCIGSGSPTNYTGTVYYKVSIDGADFPSGNGTTASLSSGQFTVPSSSYSSATKSVRINICSNQACTTYIDKLTISVLKDGENGEDGEGVFILYHDKNAVAPTAPMEKDYYKFSETNANGWYTKLTNNSVYMCQKICTAELQATTPWGAVTRISGVLTTVDDILGALEGESDQGIINYNGKIGINATAITTGAINIGGTAEKGYTDATFYANVDNSNVYLAGWHVDKDQIFKNDVYLSASDENTYPSLVKEGQDSPVRIQVGALQGSGEGVWQGRGNTEFVPSDFVAYLHTAPGEVENCSLVGFYSVEEDYAEAMANSAVLSYDGSRIMLEFIIPEYGVDYFEFGFEVKYTYKRDRPSFALLEDGSIYSSAASLKGNIDAISGTIGGFKITPDETYKGVPSTLTWHISDKPTASGEYNGASYQAIKITAGTLDSSKEKYNSVTIAPHRLQLNDNVTESNEYKYTRIESGLIEIGNNKTPPILQFYKQGMESYGTISGKTFTSKDFEGYEGDAPNGRCLLINPEDGLVISANTYIWDETEKYYFLLKKSVGVTKDWVIEQIKGKVAGAVQYLGTLSTTDGLSTKASKGDFYRVTTEIKNGSIVLAFVGDLVVAEKNNPSQAIDGTNWTAIHCGDGDISNVTAGNGLTGGGATGSVTLNVGAGNGITVTADAVAAKAGNHIIVDAGGISHGAKPLLGTTAKASLSTGRTYVTEVLIDDYGHVSGVKTATESVTDTDTWRNINVFAGPEGLKTSISLKGNKITSGALNLKAGTGLRWTATTNSDDATIHIDETVTFIIDCND